MSFTFRSDEEMLTYYETRHFNCLPLSFSSEEQVFAYIEGLQRTSSGQKPTNICPEAIKFVRKFINSSDKVAVLYLNSYKRRNIHQAASFLIKTEGAKISHESNGSGSERMLKLVKFSS
jgi:hypothetical protein